MSIYSYKFCFPILSTEKRCNVPEEIMIGIKRMDSRASVGNKNFVN